MTTLYKLNNNNNISWWTIQPTPENDGYVVTWGQDHRNMLAGKCEQTTPANAKPSPLEDQIQSQINEQIARKGYSHDIPTSVPDMPMLAQMYKDYVRLANSSASEVEHFDYTLVQPKIDGVRCLATCHSMRSRRNTDITSCPHIEEFFEHLYEMAPEWRSTKFDGELYIHGADLQTTQSAVARQTYHSSLIRGVKYMIFDLVDTEEKCYARLGRLKTLENDIKHIWDSFQPERPYWFDGPPIEIVPYYQIPGTEDNEFEANLKSWHKEFMGDGYEGTIIRNPNGLYRLNYRSYDLIKYKDQMDAEFEIVDVLEGKNRCAVFLVKNDSGKEFKVSPAYTTSRKQQVLRYKENYIGKLLTVKYEKLSRDGVPLKPIGHSYRVMP